MDTREEQINACREHLERFLRIHGNRALTERATKALRFLVASDVSFAGRPSGWAAGIIYMLVNLDRYPIRVPGFLNAEFEEFFDITMSTVRKRAAEIHRVVII